ncbi:hypothetical protein ABPG74_008735 [Tetrahymena malaccensis]
MCQYCLGYIDGPNCVSTCDDQQITISDKGSSSRQCLNSDQCDQKDNKFKNAFQCQKKCPFNQFQINLDKFECVNECPQSQFAMFDQRYINIYCQSDCSQFKSSDNKFCLQKCSHLFQLEQKDQTQCIADCQDPNQLKVVDTQTQTMKCIDQAKTQDQFKQIMEDLNQFNISVKTKIQQEYIVNTFKNILTGIQDYGLVNQDILQNFVKKFYSQQRGFEESFSERATTIESKDIKFISQFLPPFGYQYETNFNYTKLKAQGANLIIPSPNYIFDDPNISPLQVFLFEKNLWCESSQQKDRCFKDQKIISVYQKGYQDFYQQQFTVIFDIDTTKDINKYVCLTTDTFIARSIKTEILENRQGIKCTFKKNAGLFYDQDGVFQDIVCDEQKPYKTEEGTCTDKCPKLGDPITKFCIPSPLYCTIRSDSTCVTECGSDYPYKNNHNDFNQFVCRNECDDLQIIDEKEKQCLTMDECKYFLINRKKCSQECPPEYFQFTNENTPYRLCNQNCQGYVQITNDNSSKKICIQECPLENIYVVLDQNKSIKQKYCGGCPSDFPYYTKQSQYNVCFASQCNPSQIYDVKEDKCLDSINECTKYLVDKKVCQEDCPNDHYRYLQDNTPYKQCNRICDYFKGLDNQGNKFCYNTTDQCPQFISSDGKQCVSSCADDIEYLEKKQCTQCNRYIVTDVDQNTNKCKNSCEDSKMVYIFYKQNQQFKKCVEPSFCSSKMVSILNPKVCSSACLIPEVKNGDQCVQTCPQGLYLQVSTQSCEKQCDKYISSDGKFCLDQCQQIFEIADQDVKVQKKCKKCNSNQFLEIQKDQTVCVDIQKTDESLQQLKTTLTNKFDKDINTKTEVDSIKDAIGVYADQINSKLADISKKAEISEQDKNDVKKQFESMIGIVKQFSSKVNSQLSLQPEKIITNELNIVYQIAQPGKKFKTSFDSTSIKEGKLDSMLVEDLDQTSTKFKPQNLQVSFVKTNPYCNYQYCKNISLFVVTFTSQGQNRILTNDNENASTFTIAYQIPQGQQAEKQVCFSYDQQGNRKENKGQVLNGQITCSFEYSSSIFYDENCQFISKDYCQSNSGQKKENDDSSGSQSLSGGAIAGIVIGIVVALTIIIFSIVYTLKKRKGAIQSNQDLTNNISSKSNIQTEFGLTVNQSHDYEINQQQL